MGDELTEQFKAEPRVVAGVKEKLDAIRGDKLVEAAATTPQSAVSTSSTESDLYEEITPLPEGQQDMSSETREKLRECEKQLTQRSESVACSESMSSTAPIASLKESFEEVDYRIFCVSSIE